MSTAELINTGIIMGIIHVLTGPDHLSALATLSGTSIGKSKGGSFLLGIKWGIGHSVGLIIVGGALIAAEQGSGANSEWIEMNSWLSVILESFVGVFMLALGAYGLYKADKNNRDSVLADLNHHGGSGSSQIRGLTKDVEMSSRLGANRCMAAEMEDVLDRDSQHEMIDQSYASREYDASHGKNSDDVSACLSAEYLEEYLETTCGACCVPFAVVCSRVVSALAHGFCLFVQTASQARPT